MAGPDALTGDDIAITVLTSEASSWNLGQATEVFTFGNTTYSVTETDDSVSVVVNRSDNSGEVTVDWAVNEIGEAEEGPDFTGASGTLTFTAGDAQEEIDIDSGDEVTAGHRMKSWTTAKSSPDELRDRAEQPERQLRPGHA
ncbi:MAG: Calx-beta domain-containing protein [Dehalococcoidia bacterium]|nr:Calx-beta domain-containing protein [Dehalococcoidia bacterium]